MSAVLFSSFVTLVIIPAQVKQCISLAILHEYCYAWDGNNIKHCSCLIRTSAILCSSSDWTVITVILKPSCSESGESHLEFVSMSSVVVLLLCSLRSLIRESTSPSILVRFSWKADRLSLVLVLAVARFSPWWIMLMNCWMNDWKFYVKL